MNRINHRTRRVFCACSVFFLTAVMAGLIASSSAFAQDASKRYLYSSSLPTGSLADTARLAKVPMDYFQPIRINVPEGVRVAVAGENGFILNRTSPIVFGFLTGRIYRLRFTEIPLRAHQELYPTLEVVNRVYPPKGNAYEFPVVVNITKDDIDYACSGHLVTRVIYLENPELAVPVDSTSPSGKVSFDVPDGIDPVAAAEQRGFVMAIFRIGTRQPMAGPNAGDPFYFGLPPVEEAPIDIEPARK